MKPVIDHIQITVRDMSVAVAFYDRLMPLLGFNPACRTTATIDEHEFHVVEYSHPLLAFAITSPRSAFEQDLSLIHISEPTRPNAPSRMPSSA